MQRGLRFTAAICAMLLLGTVGAALLTGCGGDDTAYGTDAAAPAVTVTITDLAGRTVDVLETAERVVAIGPGSLRLVCYAGAADQVVGIEGMESQQSLGRPYILACPDLLELPVVGQGGPDSTPDPEALLTTDPDVIFVAYLVDATTADELQSKTGIPVVVLSYGPLGTFNEELMESIELVGDLTGHADRGMEVAEQLRAWLADLDGRTADISDTRKPTVYAGALGMKGTHGIESTQTDFPPFTAINAANVVDECRGQGSVIIDKEQLLEWDPDHIFVDESGYAMVRDDYGKNPGFYEALKAVKDGELYGYLPFNYYTTNVGTAIADAYFMGTVIYPDAFSDVDPEAQADEIYTFLLGVPLYEKMAADFGGFTKLDLTQ